MTDKTFFVDSNIWLYAFMSFEPGKTEKSIEIISNTSAILSTQVINELCANLIKKAGYSESEIQQTITNIYSHYQVVCIDEKIIIEASKIRTAYRLSYWDSLIVASAIFSQCPILYSEDMQHNQTIQSTTIINPFLKQT
jgi:predicted nucleic acid-binding protein